LFYFSWTTKLNSYFQIFGMLSWINTSSFGSFQSYRTVKTALITPSHTNPTTDNKYIVNVSNQLMQTTS